MQQKIEFIKGNNSQWNNELIEPIAFGVTDEMRLNTIEIGCGLSNIKSYLKIGNMVFRNTRYFNWFQRKMWKLFFGFEIENVKENK